VQLESFLSQKSHCFELHFDLFREKSAGRGAGMGAEGRLIQGIWMKMVL
jgi:hypothetical protein